MALNASLGVSILVENAKKTRMVNDAALQRNRPVDLAITHKSGAAN